MAYIELQARQYSNASDMLASAAARRARLMRPANRRADPEQARAKPNSLPHRFIEVPDGKDDRGGYTREFYINAIAKAKERERQAERDARERVSKEWSERKRLEREAIAKKVAEEKAAQDAIDTMLVKEERAPRPSIKTIARATALHFGLSRGSIEEHSRRKSITFPRQICMFIAREYTQRSTCEIGRYFDIDHTSAIHGTRKIKGMIETDSSVKSAVYAIMEMVGMQVAS